YLPDFSLNLFFVPELLPQSICYVLENVHMWKKHVILIHYANLPLIRRKGSYLSSLKQNLAFFRCVKPYHGLKQQGFATAGRAYKRNIIPSLSPEVYIIELEASDIKAKVPNFERTHSFPPSSLSKLRIARKAIIISKIPLVIAISRCP